MDKYNDNSLYGLMRIKTNILVMIRLISHEKILLKNSFKKTVQICNLIKLLYNNKLREFFNNYFS